MADIDQALESLMSQIQMAESLDSNVEATPEPVEEQEPEVQQVEALAPEPVEQSVSEVEQEALSFGWRPKSEFKGPEADFVDAKEFLRRAPIYKEIYRLQKQNAKLEAGLGELAKNYKAAEQRGREQMKRELLEEKQHAYISGDMHKASQLERQHEQMIAEDVITARQEQAAPKHDVDANAVKAHPAWQEFTQEQAWVSGTDERSKAMQMRAQELANEFADAIGDKYTLDHIPRHIEYIKLNMGLKSPEKPAAASVGRPSGKKSATQGGKHPDYNRMNETQRWLYKELCTGPNATMTGDEYIKSLEANNALNKE